MSDNLQLFITMLIYSLPGMVVGFTVHELMHAVIADRLGDPLPRSQGRLTLDPLTQIEPLGIGLLYAIGFGFARPVQINTMRIRTDAQRALVAFAGPGTNLVIALVAGLVLRIWVAAAPDSVVCDSCVAFQGHIFAINTFPYVGHGGPGFILYWVLYVTMFVNVLLFIFNMIPIPPLDGFQVFKFLFRRAIPDVIDWMERNAQILTLAGFAALFILPRLGNNSAGGAIFSAVSHITDVIFGGVTPPYPTFFTLYQALTT
jgi:Zn-dependent protease